MININIIGELTIMKQIGIKPNFSELSRIYNMDRHTIAKYYHEGGLPKTMSRPSRSYYDEFHDEIVEKMNIPSVTKTAVFRYLQNKYGPEKSNPFLHFVIIQINWEYKNPNILHHHCS